MNLKDTTIAFALRPRMVHQLPGRLRIRLPLLKRLPPENRAAVELAAGLLSVPEGIEEVTACHATGNVLILYDTERLTADDVLRYLHAATQLCVTNRDRFENLTADGLHESEERLRRWLREKLSYRLDLDGTLRIPEDVLA